MYGTTLPEKHLSLAVIESTLLDITASLSLYLEQICLVGGLLPWHLLSEGLLGQPRDPNDKPPSILSSLATTDAIELALVLNLEEPSQYLECIAALQSFREEKPGSGRFVRQQNNQKIILDILPIYQSGSIGPNMPMGLPREATESIFDSSSVFALRGYDSKRMLRAYSLRSARFSTILLLMMYHYLVRQETKYIVEICAALEFLPNAPARAAQEFRAQVSIPWVVQGVQRLRELFAAPEAEGPVAYAKESGVSLPAAVHYRRQQAYAVVRRLSNRLDGRPEES